MELFGKWVIVGLDYLHVHVWLWCDKSNQITAPTVIPVKTITAETAHSRWSRFARLLALYLSAAQSVIWHWLQDIRQEAKEGGGWVTRSGRGRGGEGQEGRKKRDGTFALGRSCHCSTAVTRVFTLYSQSVAFPQSWNACSCALEVKSLSIITYFWKVLRTEQLVLLSGVLVWSSTPWNNCITASYQEFQYLRMKLKAWPPLVWVNGPGFLFFLRFLFSLGEGTLTQGESEREQESSQWTDPKWCSYLQNVTFSFLLEHISRLSESHL